MNNYFYIMYDVTDVCSKKAERNSEATCFKSRFVTEGCQMLQEERGIQFRVMSVALKRVGVLPSLAGVMADGSLSLHKH